MDWSMCVICQTKTAEETTFPNKGKRFPAHEVFQNFLTNVKAFKDLEALPCQILFDEHCTADTFVANNACWHKTCHQQFNNDKLQRQAKKRKKDSEGDCSQRRKSNRHVPELPTASCCIFCTASTGTLISYATKCAEKSLREMATSMEDTEILARISSGDLVALEAKYHFTCLTTYRNKYRSYCRQKNHDNILDANMAKARAFVEIVAKIESDIDDGTHTFQLNELHMAYTNRLQELGVTTEINKTSFKNKLLTHFQDFGLQDVFRQGKPTVLIFPEGIKELLGDSRLLRNFENEAFLFAKVANICREEFFAGRNSNMFLDSTLENSCTAEPLTPSLHLLVSMLLYGTSITNTVSVTMPVSSISKQIYFGSKKKVSSKAVMSANTFTRHQVEREPDLATYIGLKMHFMTRSENLVEMLARFGIGITYKRVLEIEDTLAKSVCKQAFQDKLVCPSHLRLGLYTVAALDNLDYDPSSTTAIGSFHGTGISIIQFPTADNPGASRQLTSVAEGDVIALPEEYRIVPALFLKATGTLIPESLMKENGGSLEKAQDEEQFWLKHGMEIMDSGECQDDTTMSWSAFHAARQPAQSTTSAITALLPLFDEKADTPAMIKHGMEIIKKTTHFLNPQQVPVMACDCPIFAVAKQIQWSFPELLGEDKFLVMFGGLHLEKGMWTALGDLLEGSGWSAAITEAGITTSGSAQSLLKCAHITRTRHAHQVTALALAKLQQQAYIHATTNQTFQEWKESMKSYPTFLFWDIILETELQILIFIRAHREKNFDLYVEALSSLMWLFFSLDHYNYSRWVSIHLRDMMSLPENTKSEFEKNWVVNKSGKRFSFIPIDQAHEQENCKVKGDGGAVGLTQNPQAFHRWMLAGPDQACLLHKFEEANCILNASTDYKHHEEGAASQRKFLEQTKNLQATIEDAFGNPFEDTCPELLVLNTRSCVDESVITTIQNVKNIGQKQYESFKQEVLVKREKAVKASIKRNSLPLFKTPKPKKDTTGKQVASLKSNVALCSRMFIANQQRQGDLAEFFSHENQSHPPSISDFGQLYTGTKSELLKFFEPINQFDRTFECSIEDGGLLLHTIYPTGSTFQEYAEEFVQHIKRHLNTAKRVDIVQDRYFKSSIKSGTRDNRGVGRRIKVAGSTKIPQKTHFKDFLRNSQNKEELNELISHTVSKTEFQPGKDIYITGHESVVHRGPGLEMQDSPHEEADVRIIVHMKHALQCGHKNIKVRTSDTDVLVLLIGHFYDLNDTFPEMEVAVDFGIGKERRMYDIRTISTKLGRNKSIALPVFHSFSGTDTTSAFRGRGKKTAWSTWERFDEVTDAFLFMAENPFYPVTADAMHFKTLERYTVLLYDRGADADSVNDVRRSLFTKKGRSFEHIPPTQVSYSWNLISSFLT